MAARRKVPKKTRRPATAGRREQNKQATREAIVSAALGLFQSKGFDLTTTKEIARRAGIAEGTVFNYFPSKDDIALHFFEAEVDHAIDAVRSSARLRKAPLDEQLFALVQHQLDYLAPYENFIGASLMHALRPASKLGPFSVQMHALRLRYTAFVQQLVDDAVPRNATSPLRIWGPQAFWIYYLGVLLYWLHDTSDGKQNTLAFLDRSLKMGVTMLRKPAR